MTDRFPHIAAGVVYLLLILWVMSGLAPDPGRFVLIRPLEHKGVQAVAEADQKMVIGTVAHAARGWLAPGHSLRGAGACFPMPEAWTLGDHMFGPGLLAALPLAITSRPILAFNLMIALTLWIPAIGTFALARRLTGSSPAAFLAGLFAGFTLHRLIDTIHPYVHGDLWVPLALLCLHESFRRGGIRPALGLMLTSSLCMLESYYALLAAGIVLGIVTLGLIFHEGLTGLRRARGALALTAVTASSTAFFVLWPYIETGRIWGGGHRTTGGFGAWVQILPGWEYFPGAVLLALTLLTLLLRPWLARERRSNDFRLLYLATAIILWFCSVGSLPLPTGGSISGPLSMLRGILPGIDSVRALSTLATAVTVPLSIAAAFGLVQIFESRRSAAAWAVTLVLSLAFLVERFDEKLSLALTRTSTRHRIVDLAPYPILTHVLRQATGPVLGLREEHAHLTSRADRVFWTAWTEQPASACYNSLQTRLGDAVRAVSNRLPEAHAIDALVALGFENLLVDHTPITPSVQMQLLPLASGILPPGIELVDRAGHISLYRFHATPQQTDDWGALRPRKTHPPVVVQRKSGRADVGFRVKNISARTFRLPDPIRPHPFVVRWTNLGSGEARIFAASLLPVAALGPGGTLENQVRIPAPAGDGIWRVELIPETLGRAIASREVEIR